MGLLAAAGALAFSWLHGLSQTYALQWRPVIDVRPAMCKCTAGGARPECAHGSLGQLWGVLAGVLHLYSCRGLGWLPAWFLGFGGKGE